MEQAHVAPSAARFHWTRILLGRLVLRVCLYAKGGCPDTSCMFKFFCKYGREQEHAADLLEGELWGTLAVCGAAVILYWLAAMLIPLGQ